MNAIGGYFELELNHFEEFHQNALRLNLGRTSLEYILRAKNINKIYIPYFTCDVILEPIRKTGIEHEFYHINKNFEPIFDFTLLTENDYLLYTNYFGLKNDYIKKILTKKYKNIILDNSQAFYDRPIRDFDTFYSSRKFFGVPDGAYLYTNIYLKQSLEVDNSINRFNHLIGRIEEGAESFFESFKENDRSFVNQPIKEMSNVSKRLMQSINYKGIAKTRQINFFYLHNKLKNSNLLDIDWNAKIVPFTYPFWTNKKELRNLLIANKIFVAKYWPNISDWCNPDDLEYKMSEEIIHLPIDQRYSQIDLDIIIKLIENA